MKIMKIAKLALVATAAVMLLSAIGCGSSGDSDAGSNVANDKPAAKVKAGSKHDASVFVKTY